VAGDVEVSGNTADNNSDKGIIINRSDRVLVDGNFLDDNNTGIWVEASGSVSLTNNEITNSDVTGIHLRQNSTTNTVITGNQILDSGTTGLLIQNGTIA